jgi:uncharacterized SAM-binding protein YcdF (DUF218 family)
LTSLRIRLPAAIVLLCAAIAAILTIGAHAGTALVVSRPLSDPDAIVSLASHEWERLPVATEIATQNPHALLLLTLPQMPNEYNCYDCGGRIGRLERAGVAKDRIRVLPLTSGGTHGEAIAVREFARRTPIRRLMIVTSPYHTRRSLALFRNILAGTGTAIGITPASATSRARPDQWWRTPYDRWYVRYEWAAIPYYFVRYGVNAFALEP